MAEGRTIRRALWRWTRRFLKAVGALLVIALVALVGFIVFLHTGPGREWARDKIEATLSGELRGRVKIGKLSGSLLGSPSLHDVRVFDEAGNEVASAKKLTVSYALLPLLGKHVELGHVSVIEPRIRAEVMPDGTLNLAGLIPPPKPEDEEKAGPSDWVITAGKLSIERGTVTYRDGSGRAHHIDGLDASAGRVRIRGGDITTGDFELAGTWREQNLTVRAGGAGGLRDGLVRGRLTVRARDEDRDLGTVALTNVELATDLRAAEASLQLEVPAHAVERLPGELARTWRGDIALVGHVRRRDPRGSIDIELSGLLDRATVSLMAQLHPDKRQVDGTLRARDLNPRALVSTAPRGDLTGKLRFELSGASLKALRGRVQLDGAGRLELDEIKGPLRVSDFDASARLRGGVAVLEAEADTSHGEASARGTLEYLHDPPMLRHGRIEASTRAVQRLAPDWGVKGRARAVAHVSGTPRDLMISGTVRGQRIAREELRIPRARLHFRGTGPIDALDIRVRGWAPRATYGAQPLEAIAVEARSKGSGERTAITFRAGTSRSMHQARGRLSVDLRDPDATRVRIRWLRGRTGNLRFETKGGAGVDLLASGDVRFHQLDLETTAGDVRVRGSLARGVRIWSERIAIAELARALQMEPPHPRGVVAFEARLQKTGRRYRGSAQGSVIGLALAPDRPTMGGTFEASLNRREAKAGLKLSGARVGALELDVAARTPRDPLDLEAWKRAGAAAVSSAVARLRGLDVSGAQAFAGLPPAAMGRVTGDLELTDGTTRATGKISVTGARLVGYPERADATLTVNADSGTLRVAADVDGRRLGGIDGSVQLRVPRNLLDVERWKKLDEYAMAGARVEVRGLDVARLRRIARLRERAPEIPRLHGTVAGTLEIKDRLERAILSATVKNLYSRRTKKRPISASVRLTASPTTTEGAFSAKLGATPLANGNATLKAGTLAALRLVRTGDTSEIERAGLRGKTKLSRLPLRLVADYLKLEQRAQIGGSMSATGSVRGSLESPVATFAADLSDARVAKVRFEQFDLQGQVGDRAATITANIRQRRGGRLDANLSMSRRRDAFTGALTATSFDLSFLRGLERDPSGILRGVGGLADASLRLDGSMAKPRARGWARVRRGTLRPPDFAPLERIEARVDFTTTAIRGHFTARSGSGTMRGSGRAALVGFEPRSATAVVTTKRFPFPAADQTVRVDSTTRITASRRKQMWDVKAKVVRGVVSVPLWDHKKSLHPIKSMDYVVFVDERKRRRRGKRRRRRNRGEAVLVARPVAKFHVTTPNGIRLRNDILKATADANLIITLVGDDMVVQGEVRTIKGSIELVGREYEIRTAQLSFDGQVPPDPRIQVELAHAFKDLTLYVGVTGRASKITPTFRSDPGEYDPATLLAFFLGRDPDSTEPGTDLDKQAAVLALNQVIGRLKGFVEGYLPVDIDVIRVEYSDVEPGAPSRVVVGKWITENLFAAYRYTPTDDPSDNINEVKVEYRLSKRWSLEGTYGDRNKGGVDILWIRRY